MISLHSFCKDNNLPKSSVHKRCQELGIRTSDGLTYEDQSRLLKEFAVHRPSQVSVTEQPQAQSLALAVPETVSLAQFKSDRVTQVLENPVEFMRGVDAVVQSLTEAMDLAEQQQEIELHNTRKVKRHAEAALGNLKQRAAEYRLKNDLVGLLQSNELTEVSDLASQIQALQGKSVGE